MENLWRQILLMHWAENLREIQQKPSENLKGLKMNFLSHLVNSTIEKMNRHKHSIVELMHHPAGHVFDKGFWFKSNPIRDERHSL